jgi:cytidylate kinase
MLLQDSKTTDESNATRNEARFNLFNDVNRLKIFMCPILPHFEIKLMVFRGCIVNSSLQFPNQVTNKINIAIDGYSSCGKSTLARAMAKNLNYIYIDSGAMYRAVAYYALEHGYIQSKGEIDEKMLVESLHLILIQFKYNSDTQEIETFLNGTCVDKEIRSMQVSAHVSAISAIKEVRGKLVRIQQRMSENGGVVMDGRDIGTVVLPEAELKVFMTADVEVRAQRRFLQLKNNGVNISIDDVRENIAQRDLQDTTRAADPLRKAADAVVLDNSNLTEEEQFSFLMVQARKAIELKTA